jgi:hypothetical protein
MGGWATGRGQLPGKHHFTELPHAFTADGIHEARCWVDQRLREVSSTSHIIPS